MKLLKYWLISSSILLFFSCIDSEKNNLNSNKNNIINDNVKKDSVSLEKSISKVDSISQKDNLFKDTISYSLKNKQKTKPSKIEKTDILDIRDITDPVPINVKQNDSLKK